MGQSDRSGCIGRVSLERMCTVYSYTPRTLHCLCLDALRGTADEKRELASKRRDLETREEAVRDTGREVGLSLDQGRTVLGRERDKLRSDADHLEEVKVGECFSCS